MRQFRYTARTDSTYPQIGHVRRWEEDGGVDLGDDVYFTPTEANIIAWALNQVADGNRLAFMSDHFNFNEPGGFGYYDGPTDGVAP